MPILSKKIWKKATYAESYPNTYWRKTISLYLLPLCMQCYSKFEHTYSQAPQWNFQISLVIIHSCLLILQNKPIYMGPRDYRCPFCPKKSGTKQHMQTHIRIHTGEKPFCCNYCNYASSDKGNLNKHIALHHN